MRLWTALAILSTVAVLSLGAYAGWNLRDLPQPGNAAALAGIDRTVDIYDRGSQLIAQRAADGQFSIYTPLSQMGSYGPAATLAAEDRGFYHHAAVDIDARLTRGRFERLVASMLRDTETLLDAVLAKAGVAAEDVGEVVTTGGSSAIPAFRALLAAHFPRSNVRDAAAFTSVASGLAMPGVEEAVAA